MAQESFWPPDPEQDKFPRRFDPDIEEGWPPPGEPLPEREDEPEQDASHRALPWISMPPSGAPRKRKLRWLALVAGAALAVGAFGLPGAAPAETPAEDTSAAAPTPYGTAPDGHSPGALGVGISDEAHGVVVREVFAGMGAERAGIAPGDVIVAVNLWKVASVADVGAIARKAGAGSTATVLVRRRGAWRSFRVTLGDASSLPAPRP